MYHEIHGKDQPVVLLHGSFMTITNNWPDMIARLAKSRQVFFVHGDADGVRLDHIAEMFRLKGGDVMGDLRPRSSSRLPILPNTTHVTLMQKIDAIAPMINDFLDATPAPAASALRRD
jgi:pimeloyl-ACP methyl ester carboxylesterase